MSNARFGQALQGIRENEARMQALGYQVLRIKLVAFVFAGTLAGLAGALLANHNLFVSPSLMHWTASANLIIMVIVGGVIPAQDYQFLFDAGAVAVFGPGTKISDAAISILEVLLED